MTRTALIPLLAAALLAGCGGSSKPEPAAGAGTRLVDLSAQPPFVNGLDYDAEADEFLLTTNRGFFRIGRKDGEVTEIEGRITHEGKSSTVGTFLEMEPLSDGRFIGSGHPDTKDALPEFLGFLESRDGGRTWTSLSRMGDADLHKFVEAHGKIFAFDAVLGALLVSSDGARTFEERFTPRGLVIDFVVDPEDANYLLAATEDQLYRTEDQGERWRAIEGGEGFRLVWPAAGRVVRASKDGTVSESTDRGATWKPIGRVDGEPYKFETTDDPNHLYLALATGAIHETTDGGKTWKAVFTP